MVAAHPSDLAAGGGAGLRTAYVARPLEHGPGGFRAGRGPLRPSATTSPISPRSCARRMRPLAIDFYFDFSSPYSYIASEWIEALAARHGRTVRWNAILLGVDLPGGRAEEPGQPSDQARILAARLRALGALRRRAATRCRRSSRSRPRTRRASSGGCTTRAPASAAAWARHCLRAYFTRGVDLSDAASLKALARRVRHRRRRRPKRVWTDPRWKARLKAVLRRRGRARRVRRALLRRRRRAVLGQRPARADRALARRRPVLGDAHRRAHGAARLPAHPGACQPARQPSPARRDAARSRAPTTTRRGPASSRAWR